MRSALRLFERPTDRSNPKMGFSKQLSRSADQISTHFLDEMLRPGERLYGGFNPANPPEPWPLHQCASAETSDCLNGFAMQMIADAVQRFFGDCGCGATKLSYLTRLASASRAA